MVLKGTRKIKGTQAQHRTNPIREGVRVKPRSFQDRKEDRVLSNQPVGVQVLDVQLGATEARVLSHTCSSPLVHETG